MVCGCSYFTYVKEKEEESRLSKLYERAKVSKILGVVFTVIGFLLCGLMVTFLQLINEHGETVHQFWSALYLITSRPLYIFGFTLMLIPMLAGAKSCKPMK